MDVIDITENNTKISPIFQDLPMEIKCKILTISFCQILNSLDIQKAYKLSIMSSTVVNKMFGIFFQIQHFESQIHINHKWNGTMRLLASIRDFSLFTSNYYLADEFNPEVIRLNKFYKSYSSYPHTLYSMSKCSMSYLPDDILTISTGPNLIDTMMICGESNLGYIDEKIIAYPAIFIKVTEFGKIYHQNKPVEKSWFHFGQLFKTTFGKHSNLYLIIEYNQGDGTISSMLSLCLKQQQLNN